MPHTKALLLCLALAAALPCAAPSRASDAVQTRVAVEGSHPLAPAPLTPGEAFQQGYRHLIGEGVPRDATMAAKFFLQAALAGEPQAQFQLGTLFMDGTGLPKDSLWAYYWLDTAGRSPALPEIARAQVQGRLRTLLPELTPDQKRRLGLGGAR